MKKSCFVLSLFLFVHGALGMDVIEWLNTSGWGEVVSVSSTSLLFQFKGDSFGIFQGDLDYKYWEIFKPYEPKSTYRRSSEYIKNNELLVITPDGATRLGGGHHVHIDFIPVSFRNQHKGLKILRVSYEYETIIIGYLAFSDTPMEVGEEDVEMIWKEGEFRTLEEHQAMVQHDKEEEDKHIKFVARLDKVRNERFKTPEDRRDFIKKVKNDMEQGGGYSLPE